MKTHRTTAAYSLTELVIKQLRLVLLRYSDENHQPYFSGKHTVIYLVLKGTYSIGAQGISFTGRRGQAFIIKGGDGLVTELARYGTHLFAFELNEDCCGYYASAVPEAETQECIKGSELYSCITRLCAAFESKHTEAHLDVQQRFIQLLKQLFADIRCLEAGNKLHLFLKELISSRAFINLSEQQIAARAKVSAKQLARCIKYLFGCNFRKLRSKLKVEYAAMLLRETDIPLGEVAEQSGFNNYKSLSKEFKKQEGCIPQQYRERYRQEQVRSTE